MRNAGGVVKEMAGRWWVFLPVVLAVAAVAAALAGGVWAEEGKPAKSAADPAAKPAAQSPPDITFMDDDPEPPAGAKKAANPFSSGQAAGGASRKDGVPGYVELSSGLKIPGYVYTTRAKRLKIYNLKREMYEYVPVPALKSMEVKVDWEREDPEWRFKEAGNPEKVFTGRKYPVRQLAWKLTLRNDHVIEGHILGQPLYVEHNGKAERFILHKRDKGPMGQELKDLVYIRRVEFGPEAYNQAVEELKAKAAAGAGGKPSPAADKPKDEAK